ncbi:MAG: hypothetical protein KAW92_10830 [Candidatus Cloacimonetes bacterium]|nr:hypothetical protein [Candidatus Cloacimonadota bacterium]
MFKKLCILEKLILIVLLLILTSCATTQKQPIAKPETFEKFEITNNLDNSLSDLTTQITNSITEDGKKKIAVIEFSDLEGNVTQFGKYLAEELITRLFRTKKFEVVERQLLNKIISEQKLSITGMIDPNSAKELGRILGVDAIVSGTITDFVTDLKVNARIISTETGKVFGVAATNIVKDDNVRKLMGIISTVQKEEVQKQTEKKEISKEVLKKVEEEFYFDKIFKITHEGKEIWRVTLRSYIYNEVKGHLVFKFFLENFQITESSIQLVKDIGVYRSKVVTYLLDNLGNKYTYSEFSSTEGIRVMPKRPAEFILTFKNIKSDATSFFLYMYGTAYIVQNGSGNRKTIQPYFGPIKISK